MFRRQTDQVYEMLQQVQRQMSNAADGGSSWSSQASQGSSAPGFGKSKQGDSPWPTPGQVPPSGAPSGTGQQAPPTAVTDRPISHDNLGSAQHPRPDLQGHSLQSIREQSAVYQRPPSMARGLSIPLASVLMLVWILTVAVSYMIGRHHEASSQRLGGVGFAEGDAGERIVDDSAPPITGGGSQDPSPTGAPVAAAHQDILILKSVRNFDAGTLRRWEEEAIKLNKVSARDPDLPAFFAVRRPSSGGLQLVFGKADGQFGVDRDDYQIQATMLRKVYQGAMWKGL